MPVIWITVSFVLGIITADQISWTTRIWSMVGTGFSISVVFFLWLIGKKRPEIQSWIKGLILAIVLAYFIGGIRYQLSLPDLQDPGQMMTFAGKSIPVKITGIVNDFPDQRDQIVNLTVKAEWIEGEGDHNLPVKGFVLVKTPVETKVSYGDRIRVTGFLKIPPQDEDFNYRDYLFRQGIYVYISRADVEVLESGQGSLILDVIYTIRTRALDLVYQLWPDPESSLLAGILLGIESGISDQVQKAFRETGTTHVIAISGFNITIVAGFFSRFFGRILDPRKGAAAALIGICIYTILVGADAAVVRAAVMGGLSIFAQQIGRRQHGLNAAALASLVMILVNPQLPWDISFQLSLSATLGLILYADPFSAWFLGLSSKFFPLEIAQKITRPISEFVLFTFAAQLTTMPVMVYHFDVFSISTFLANPAILPVQPPIMVFGGLALIVALIWFPLGKIFAPLVYPFVLYTIRTVEWFSRLPIKSIHLGDVDLVWVVLFYFVLIIITFFYPLLYQLRQWFSPTISLAGLMIGVLLVWRSVFATPDGYLHLYILDVGQGTGIYLQSPEGYRILINGGSSTKLLSDHLGRLMPPFARELDLLVITSPQAQDLDALAANLPRFKPGRVVWIGSPGLCWESENLWSVINLDQIPYELAESGQYLVFPDGLRVDLVSQNPRGGSLLIEYHDFRALLPFGVTNQIRTEWIEGKRIGNVSMMLLADNGYQSSNPSDWIWSLNPQLALLSVGLKNSQGLPDRGLLDRLAGYSLLRTDQNGTIHLSTDGEKLWIEVERLD